MVGVNLSHSRSLKHEFVNLIFNLLNISLIRYICQERHRFLTPCHVSIRLKEVPNVLILRLLNQALLHHSALSSHKEASILIHTRSRNHSQAVSSKYHQVAILCLGEYVTLDWVSQVFLWVLPCEYFSIAGYCHKAVFMLHSIC